MTAREALEAVVAECPGHLPAESHERLQQRHVHVAGGPVRCHSASFILALPDSRWRRSDAQLRYEVARRAEERAA